MGLTSNNWTSRQPARDTVSSVPGEHVGISPNLPGCYYRFHKEDQRMGAKWSLGATHTMMRFRWRLPVAEASWFWCLTITVAYVITGRMALLLAVPPGYATAIFPPAGIAMAAVLSAGW